MTAKPKKQDTLDVPFETAMQRLETIVSALEGDELSLEKSLDQFEEGMLLAKTCERQLESANARVEKIMKDFSGQEKRVPLTEGETHDLLSDGEGDE